MATYECSKCGMGVNATCAKCDAPLVDDSLKLDDGNEVQISKCPNGHGKIKSPMCCGQDMTLDSSAGEFFCEICGKIKPLPQCCGGFMVQGEKG